MSRYDRIYVFTDETCILVANGEYLEPNEIKFEEAKHGPLLYTKFNGEKTFVDNRRKGNEN